jgi:hypothetical protein
VGEKPKTFQKISNGSITVTGFHTFPYIHPGSPLFSFTRPQREEVQAANIINLIRVIKLSFV